MIPPGIAAEFNLLTFNSLWSNKELPVSRSTTMQSESQLTSSLNQCKCAQITENVLSNLSISWLVDVGHSSSHAVRWSSQISDTVRIVLQAIFVGRL